MLEWTVALHAIAPEKVFLAKVAAAPAATVLCVGLLFFTLGNFLLQIMFCLRKTGVMVAISVAAAVSNFVLNYVLIGRYDFLGAAQATLLSYLIFALLTGAALTYVLKRRIDVQRDQKILQQ